MSIGNALNQIYTGYQVTTGTISTSADGSTVTFTETAALNPDSLQIRMDDPAANTIDFTLTSGAVSTIGRGNVLANSTSGFIFAVVMGGDTQYYYVSNTPQPHANGNAADPTDVVTLPTESSGKAPVYQACYCGGTLVRTARGDVAVENLVVGDRVVTVAGEEKAVRWIGSRSYAGRFLAANPALHPVRFLPGSLGMDAAGNLVPSRDLLVSPRHSMLIDGVLVPAELLVNGSTVLREAGVDPVCYFHVELPEHDAIWAENAASESFIDDGSRFVFQNADSFAAMYPNAGTPDPVFCAPRVEGGDVLDAIRRRLGTLATGTRRAA